MSIVPEYADRIGDYKEYGILFDNGAWRVVVIADHYQDAAMKWETKFISSSRTEAMEKAKWYERGQVEDPTIAIERADRIRRSK